MQLLQAAVTIAPGYAEAWNNLGVLQRDVGLVHVRPSPAHNSGMASMYEAWQAVQHHALKLMWQQDPRTLVHGSASSCLGWFVAARLGMQEAIASYEECTRLAPQSRNAAQNRLLALNYILPGEDPAVRGSPLHPRAPKCSCLAATSALPSCPARLTASQHRTTWQLQLWSCSHSQAQQLQGCSTGTDGQPPCPGV